MTKILKLTRLVALIALICALGMLCFLAGCTYNAADTEEEGSEQETSVHFTSVEDVGLYDVDGYETNYAFTYNGEEFRAQYIYDTWTLFDSYKITNKKDMKYICQAFIDTHPVHGADMESFRTADDMVYEWKQHNLAYKYLPEDNSWRESAKNVDFDPYDQGRSFEEIYEDRTGQEFDLSEYVKEHLDDGEKLWDLLTD